MTLKDYLQRITDTEDFAKFIFVIANQAILGKLGDDYTYFRQVYPLKNKKEIQIIIDILNQKVLYDEGVEMGRRKNE